MLKLGTLPEWIAAIGTTGAFLAGLVILGRQLRNYAAVEDERQSAQARLIGAWWEFDEDYMVYVENSSPLPVYNCDVQLMDGNHSLMPEITYPVVAPRKRNPLPFAEVAAESADESPRVAPSPTAWVRIEFTDSQGNRWTRQRDGVLALVRRHSGYD